MFDSFITVPQVTYDILRQYFAISALTSDGIILHTVEVSFGGVLHCSGACPKTGM